MLVVRPARCQDLDPVGRFLTGLSPNSRYHRFFTPFHHVRPALVRDLVTTGPGRHVLLALDDDTVVGHVIAVEHPAHTVDVGVVAADAHRFQGIGGRLVRELGRDLAAAGCADVRCEVLSENRFVLDWLRRIAPGLRFERSGELVTVHGPLP